MTTTPGRGRRPTAAAKRRPHGSTAAGPASAARPTSRPSARRYASGSTAAARRGPGDPATEATARRAKLTGRAVVLAVVAAVLLVSYASSVRAWLQQRSEVALLHDQISERTAAVASLRTEVRRWQDPAYVEAQARQRFGWVMPGETGYRVVGLGGRPLGAPQVTGDTSADTGVSEDWWSTVWRSVEAAAKEPPSAAERRSQMPATRIGRSGAVQHATPKQPHQQPDAGDPGPRDTPPHRVTPGQRPANLL